MSRLAIVTATLDADRADPCISSWTEAAAQAPDLYVVRQATGNARGWFGPKSGGHLWQFWSPEILGVVPAFAIGVQKALEDGAEIIACLHDDLEIHDAGWDETVVRLFKTCPRAGLCGFGGGKGLGRDDIYQAPYDPMQLARQWFISNMRDAEAHGARCTVAMPVACLDGFSQIGLRSFWMARPLGHDGFKIAVPNLFEQMAAWGVIHHCYDSALGAWAKRLGWQVWYLPIACHHFGGRTAVGDARYTQWANDQRPSGRTDISTAGGDQQFWIEAHRIVYDQFRDCLPIRT